MSRTVAIDWETFFIKKKYSVSNMGNWRYTHDTEFDPYLLSVSDGEDSWAGEPAEFNWEYLRDAFLIAHNAAFDISVLRRYVELGNAPTWLLSLPFQCTANMTACLADERSLKGAVKILEGRNLSKTIRDDMSGVHWKDLNPIERQNMIKYAAGDAIECHGLWTKYSPKWSAFEQRLSSLTMKQCDRGVRIDVDKLHKYIEVLVEVIFNLEKDLPWTGSGAKPSSPIAIAEQCRKVGIPAPPVKGEDEEGFNEWEKTWSPVHPWVSGAGKWRSLNKLLVSLQTMDDRLRENDTIDFSLLYFGGHTGRWSGGGSGFNMQNLRKVPLFIKDYRLVILPDGLGGRAMKEWIAENTDFQLDIRSLIIPRAGKKALLADLSQIEPRILAWFTNNTALLDLLRTGMSIYEAFARTNMGWKGGILKKEDADKYQLSKIQVLGLGYGCAWEKFIAIASGYGITLSEVESKLIVSGFRETNQPIVDFWGSLQDLLRRSAGNDFIMGLPSGREMVYRGVQQETKMKINRETRRPESRTVFTAGVGQQRKEFYGGKLAENLVQAVARDVFGEHMLALEDQVGDVLFHCHDEVFMEVEPDVSENDVAVIMSKTPEWMPGLLVSAEIQEVPHYCK